MNPLYAASIAQPEIRFYGGTMKRTGSEPAVREREGPKNKNPHRLRRTQLRNTKGAETRRCLCAQSQGADPALKHARHVGLAGLRLLVPGPALSQHYRR